MQTQAQKFRIPYMGSKQMIVNKVYDAIQKDVGSYQCLFSSNQYEHFYDLFCGGGAVGYWFYQQGYKTTMNDFNKPLMELHEVLNMQESPLTEELMYKWISREEFNEIKHRQDWYGCMIGLCWSFGFNQSSYIFGKDIEDYKKQLHFVVVNKCENAGNKFLDMIGACNQYEDFSQVYQLHTMRERRLFIRSFIKRAVPCKPFGKHDDLYMYCTKDELENVKDLSIIETAKFLNTRSNTSLNSLEQLERLGQLQQLQQLGQLQQLEQLEQLKRLRQLESASQLDNLKSPKNITFLSKNYYEVDIKPNSIIYCDPPYLNTESYKNAVFDFDKFDNWVRDMKKRGVKVYISEYTNHNDEWREVCSINKTALLKATTGKRKVMQEKVFCNM